MAGMQSRELIKLQKKETNVITEIPKEEGGQATVGRE